MPCTCTSVTPSPSVRVQVTRWPGRLSMRLAFHRACHARGTAYAEGALTLLRSIDGL